MFASIEVDCGTYQKDGEFADFLANMHLICDAKKQPFDDPDCECPDDLCVMMFLPSSDFMKKCGHLFSSEMLETMFEDCQEHKCEGWFEGNIELICKQKGAPPFEFPTCGCTLYPFGAMHHDVLGPDCDDCVHVLDLQYPLIFLCNIYSKIHICENGIFSFDVAWSSGSCTWQATPNIQTHAISPFWADMNVDIGGIAKVWYRETINVDLLAKATDDVINHFDPACSSGFQAKSLFIITWHLVRPWEYYRYIFGPDCILGDPDSNCNGPRGEPYGDEADTFQVVLINGVRDDCYELYALFIYDQIEWIESWGVYPVVGISDGPGDRIKWPPHDGHDAWLLTGDSNIDHNGCYMYKVSGCEPQDPQCNTP